MYIVLMHYRQPLAEVDKWLSAHRAHLDTGYQRNYLIASGPRNPREGGVLISQLTNRTILEDFISQDPFIVEEIADYEIFEFSPVKCHQAFECFLT